MARWVPTEELMPDYRRQLNEQVQQMKPPGEDLLIARQRQQQDEEERQQREAQSKFLDAAISYFPPPGAIEQAQQSRALEDMATAGESSLLTPPPQPTPPQPRETPSLGPPADASTPDDLGSFVAPSVGGRGVAQAPSTPPTDDGSTLIDPSQRRVPNLGQGMPLPPATAGPRDVTDIDPSERMVPGETTPAVGPRDLGAVTAPPPSDARRPTISAAEGDMSVGQRLGLLGEVSQAPQQILFGAAHGGMTGEGAAQGILGTADEQVRGEQLLGDVGMEEGTARTVGGRVLEAVVDPLNFVPIGLGGKFRGAAQEGLRLAMATGDEAAIAAARSALTRATVGRAAAEGIGSGVLGGVGSVAGEEIGQRVGGDTGAMLGSAAGSLLGGGLGAGPVAESLEHGAPRAMRRARDVSEWIEKNGLTPGLSTRVVGDEAAQPSRLMSQLAAGEKINPTELLKRSNEIDFISAEDAAKTLREATEDPSKMPAYLNAVQDFMLAQRQKTLDGQLTVRDVAKAYAMTLSSIGAAEVSRPTAEKAFGRMGEEFVQASKTGVPSVRPEEAAAHWLFTEPGQRALDAIENGRVDEAAWRDLIERRRGYGRGGLETVREYDRALDPLTGKPIKGTGEKRVASDFLSPVPVNRKGEPTRYNITNLQQLTDELNAAHGDPALMNKAIEKTYGLSKGKVGFVKSLLGFGDTPTFDAVELNFWLTGQGDISRLKTPEARVVRALKGTTSGGGKANPSDEFAGLLGDPRVSEMLRDKLLGRIQELQAAGLGTDMDPDMAAHLMHHWIWDKAKGVVTSHEGMMKAQQFAGAAPGALAGMGVDEEGNPTGEFDPLKAGLGMVAGTLGTKLLERPGAVARAVERVRPLSARAERLMATYAEHGPRWAEEIRQRAIDEAATALKGPRGTPSPDPRFLADTMAAIERRLPDAKNIMTEVTLPQLDNIVSQGKLLSKFDAGLSDDEVALATAANVGPKRFAKAGFPSTPEGAIQGARDFVAKEREADKMVLGGTDIPRVYARITEGQALPGETKGLVHIVWDEDTPRVTSLHHHFALAAPDYGLHKPMPTAFKQALWRDEVPGTVSLGGGRSIANTPWTVGPEQENTLRAANLMMAMPGEVVDAVKNGQISSPDELAAAIMRGQRPRGYKPLEGLATAAGHDLESAAADEFTMGASLNRNRSESLIVEPDLAHVKALYVTGEDVEAPFDGVKRNPSPVQAAESIRQKILEETGKDVPIIRKDITLEGDKLPPEQLSPGRQDIRDTYTKTGLTDIGGFNPALGAAGGGLSAPTDEQGDPEAWNDPDRLSRMALGAVVGALVKTPGTSRNRDVQKILDSYYGAAKGGMIHRDSIAVNGYKQAIVRAVSDRNVALNNLTETIEKAAGRRLLPEERADLLVRVNADKQAEVFARENLRPIVQEIDKTGDRANLEVYLTLNDNVDKADAVGERVATRKAPGPAKASPNQRFLDDAKTRLTEVERIKAADPQTLGIDEELVKARRKVRGLEARVAGDIQGDIERVQVGSLRAAVAGREARDVRQFSTGLDRSRSVTALADLEKELGPERWTAIERAADKIHTTMRDLVQMKVDAGIWSKELADDLNTRFPNYIPTKILDYMTEQSDRLSAGKKIGLSDRGLKQLTDAGTVRERETPLASVLRYVYDTHTAVAKNNAFNAFSRLADLRVDQNATAIIRPVLSDTEWSRLTRLGKLPKDAISASAGKTNEWVPVQGFTDGVVKRYAVHRDIAPIVTMEAPYMAPPAIQAAMAVYRGLQTSLSPLFLASNAVLDAVAYTLRESVRSGGPQHIPGIVADLAKSYLDEFGALARGEMSEATKAFYTAGGGQAGESLMGRQRAVLRPGASVDQLQKQGIKRVDRLVEGNTYGSVREAIPGRFRDTVSEVSSLQGLGNLAKQIALMQPVEAIGRHIEAAPRNASFNRALRRGEGELQSMINGRTVTIDFAQGGTWAKAINQFVPFFNVGVQGAATLPRMIREGKQLNGNHRAMLGTVAATLVAPMIGAEVWNNADEQRRQDYADVPDYVKDQGVVVMWPTEAPVDQQTGDRRPQYTLIRLREFSPFAIMGRELFNRATGGGARGITDLASSSWNAVSPVSSSSPTDFFSSFNPLVLPGTGTQLALNKDFFRGGDIATTRNDQKASALAKGISGGINALGRATGVGGLEDVRPSQVEFTGQDLGGGVYRTYGAASDIASRVAGGEDLNQSGTVEDIPVVGGVARRFGGSAIGGNLARAQDEARGGTAADMAREAGIPWRPSPAQGTVNGVQLTRQQQAEYQRAINQFAEETLADMMASDEWVSGTPDQKEQMLSRVMSHARQRAISEVVQQDPEYQARQLQATVETVGR